MKKYTLSILLAITTFITFSQGLTPQIQFQGTDTLFCFTIPQSKLIAHKIIGEMFCDSISKQMEAEIESFNNLVDLNNQQMISLGEKNFNQEAIIANQKISMDCLKLEIEFQKWEVKKQKWFKRFCFAGMLVGGYFAIK